jgi:hypothetical protein
MTEWLCAGLQNLLSRFNSGSVLQYNQKESFKLGSYRIKCAVSGLPINEDDDVYVIFIAEKQRRLPKRYHNPTTEMRIYIDDAFEFLSLPYLGKYSGYGDVDSSTPDGVTEKFMTCLIKDAMDTLEVGENPFHEPACSPNDINDIDDVMKYMHSDRIRINGYPINYAAVLKEVFDTYTQKHTRGFGPTTSLEDAINDSIDKINSEFTSTEIKIHDGEWSKKMQYSNGFMLDVKLFYRREIYHKTHPRVDREIATGINQVANLMIAMREWGVTISPLQYISDFNHIYDFEEINALRVKITADRQAVIDE